MGTVAERQRNEKDSVTRGVDPVIPVALAPQPATPATGTPASDVSLMFERLARDPAVDVEKLERLIAMQERILAHNAKAEFYAAFAEMQGEIPTVIERGVTNNGKYATHEDIVDAVRPVLQKHGFMLSFRTVFTEKTVKVRGVLAHRSGYSEETEFVSSADTSGNKNAIQALGSAQSYGQRYTTKALLNIATRGDDDDGRRAGGKPEPDMPKGFEDWWTDMQSNASDGAPALEQSWKASKLEYKNYLIATKRQQWNDLKAKALRVKTS